MSWQARDITGRARKYAPRLVAGLLDAGTASIGTFLIGLFAARILSAEQLGVYAVVFAAFLVGSGLSRSLNYLPVEAESVEAARGQPIGWYLHSLSAGSLTGLLGALIAIGLILLATTSRIAPSTMAAAGLAAVLSPAQDHGRQLLHLSEKSHFAALTSLQFTAVIVFSLLLLDPGDTPLFFLFATLAAANVFSIITPLALGIRNRAVEVPSIARLIVDRGRWLFGAEISPTIAIYGVRSLLANVVSFEVAGYAEAARILAAPILVGGNGIIASLKNKLLGQGIGRNERRWDLFVLLFLAAITAFWSLVLLVGPTRVWLEGFLPTAYAVPLVLVLSIVSAILTAFGIALDSVALGSRKESAIMGGRVSSSIVSLSVVVPLASLFGAAAQPTSEILGNTTQVTIVRRAIKQSSEAEPSDERDGPGAGT